MILYFFYLTERNNHEITLNLSSNRKLTCHVLSRPPGNIYSDEWQTSIPQALVILTADFNIKEYSIRIYVFKKNTVMNPKLYSNCKRFT